MAKLLQAFDSNQHEDMSNFDPVPADEYVMQVTNSDLCDTKDKTGKYIKLELSIIKGEFTGRKVWTNLNVVNKNPQAVEIAQKELATICRACNKVAIQDTVELHGIPMLVKLRIKPAKGDYPPQNVPSGYLPAGINPVKKTVGTKTAKKKIVKKPVEEQEESPGWDDDE